MQGSGVAGGARIAQLAMSEVGDFPSTKTLAVHLPRRPCASMLVNVVYSVRRTARRSVQLANNARCRARLAVSSGRVAQHVVERGTKQSHAVRQQLRRFG
jgi:hypothetical protein